MHCALVVRNGIALFTALALPACFGTPRVEDAHAPSELYESWGIPGESKCDRPVAMIPPGAAPGRPMRLVADISATCYPGYIWICEHRLKERACALGADAVLLTDAEPGPNPAGGSRQSAVTRNGRAVKWAD